MLGRPKPQLSMSEKERVVLERWARRPKTSQALALRSVLGINRLRIWDIDSDAMAKFEANMGPLGFEVVIAGNAADAVSGADIITTCTADKMNATGRVKRPRRKSVPPTTSMIPANQMSEPTGATPPPGRIGAGNANHFAEPTWK